MSLVVLFHIRLTITLFWNVQFHQFTSYTLYIMYPFAIALSPKPTHPVATSRQCPVMPPPVTPSPPPTQSAPHSPQPDPHHTHPHRVPISTLSQGLTNQIASGSELSKAGSTSKGKFVKSSYTHSLPTVSYKPHPLTTPPGVQMGGVKFDTPSPPPSPLQSPVYYNPPASNLLAKSQDISVNYNPQASNLQSSVQVVSVTKLTPTPRMTPQREITGRPLNPRVAYHDNQQPRRQHYDVTAYSQYPHTQGQHNGSTLVSSAVTTNSSHQNVSTSSQREEGYRHVKSHSRAQSHGHLDYSYHSNESNDTRVQTANIRGRSSVPHISLHVQPPGGGSNVPPIRRTPSGSSLQGAVGTLPGPQFATPPFEQDMGTRRHSVHDSISAQVFVSGKDFINSSKQSLSYSGSSSQPPGNTTPIYYDVHSSNLQSHSSKTLATSVYYAPRVSSQQSLSSKTSVNYTSSVQDSSSVYLASPLPVTTTTKSSNQIAHSSISMQRSSSIPYYISSNESPKVPGSRDHSSARSLAESNRRETRNHTIVQPPVNRSHSVPSPTPGYTHSAPTPVRNVPSSTHYVPSPTHTSISHTSHSRLGHGTQVPLRPTTISNTDLNRDRLSLRQTPQNTDCVTPPLLPGSQFSLLPVTMTTNVADNVQTSKVQSAHCASVPAIQVNNRKPSLPIQQCTQPSLATNVTTPTDVLATPPTPKGATPPSKVLYRRGHARNHSLGNDLPHKRSLTSMGHSRNRSLGSITGPFPISQQPLTSLQPLTSRPGSVGNLSVTSDTPRVREVSRCVIVHAHTHTHAKTHPHEPDPNPTTTQALSFILSLSTTFSPTLAFPSNSFTWNHTSTSSTAPPILIR